MFLQYYFQYAITGQAKCKRCLQIIQKGAFRVKPNVNGSRDKWYHFDCFWKQGFPLHLYKSCIMIQVQDIVRRERFWFYVYDMQQEEEDYRITKDGTTAYVSLDTLETNAEGLTLIIRPEDIENIRQNFVLVSERRSPYYLPTIIRGRTCLPCRYYLFGGCNFETGAAFYLQYAGEDCHPECLAATDKINIDAKDFKNYDILTDDEKTSLDELFKKDDDAYYSPKVIINDFSEDCESASCQNVVGELFRFRDVIKANDPRIRYGPQVLHPRCFGSLYEIKIDAKDVVGYDSLDVGNKAILDAYIKKPDEYDTPSVEEAQFDDYCCAKECLHSQAPSKFPFPYTIRAYEHLQISYQHRLYHPRCFQASGKIDVEAKDIYNYPFLDNHQKQSLDEIFKKTEKRKLDDGQPGSSAEEDKENDEPATKKSKDENGNEQAEVE